jgi:hypothetical protein
MFRMIEMWLERSRQTRKHGRSPGDAFAQGRGATSETPDFEQARTAFMIAKAFVRYMT